ncbi:transcription cofactor vestigial-like protein 1 [Xyrauchen texanus]|uniref:transcription cofactor vestigial-like protein 1 n=1 Tax=Xyrauchen texanus TaxID=154827 RepID=UPI0022426809|nr:transcription cofactor vestigial-like protein 1 [Xyrauchen texanus]XP_052010544.1 transcription cofactor vestigial-like protein 1 [Xyrauchen texanus]
MEENESPVAGKTEEQSGSVLLTYFQGDISSMVDDHFSRALSNATKPKREYSKSKRNRKSSQTIGGYGSSPWEAHSHTGIQSMFPPERLQLGTSCEPQSNNHIPLNHSANSTILWSGDSSQGMSLALPSMGHPLAVSDGSVVAGHQYTHSLLNLLHNDRPDLGTVVVNPSKQDHISEWTKYPRFGNQMSSEVNLDSGVQVIEKKDFYWC